jgi:16S rRNA (uracil1498-N3)-methyltransferase
MQMFYTPTLTHEISEFQFDPEESRHIVKVLRKKEGEILQTTNGNGYLFTVRILEAHPQHCMAEVISSQRKPDKRYYLHLAVAPTKNNTRYEWFLEKATEIGVDEITPLICKRSERKAIKAGRMEKVLESAMKQSLRAYLPKLNQAISFHEFIKKEHQDLKLIAHCEEDEKTDLKRRLGADQDVLILIGPEGDFTREEIRMAYDQGFGPVSLGESRLRTETAAIVAATTVTIVNSG